jgi:flavin-dependent dehydrogenase
MIKSEEIKTNWDCVIIGAGPAGSMAAKKIASQNKEVLLIDKAIFPRSKVCGCCLNGAAQAALAEAGLQSLLVDNRAVLLDSLQLFDKGKTATIALPIGASLSRDKLDLALVNAARQNGARFLQGTTARVLSLDHLPVIELGSANSRDQIQTKLIIVADGLAGRSLELLQQFNSTAQLRSRFGAGTILDAAPAWIEAGKIYMACGNGGYVGMVKLEDGRLNIAAAFDRNFSRQLNGIASAAAHLLNQNGLPVPVDMLEAHWRGTDSLSRSRSRLADKRLFLIGDACGYTEPFTGEGMAWALRSGLTVADLALAAINSWDDNLINLWHKKQKALIQRKVPSKVLAFTLRNGLMREAMINLLSRLPDFASQLVRDITDKQHA